MSPAERHRRGLKVLEALGPDRRARLVQGLQVIAPELADRVAEFAFGDLYARPGLDLKSRELITVAALASIGAAPAQLKPQLAAALAAGWSAAQLTEALMQLSVYAGFPAAMNGLGALREALAETRERTEGA
jgi:4-carboxymuconolactone decarboxylase